jgi:hypothetical protein
MNKIIDITNKLIKPVSQYSSIKMVTTFNNLGINTYYIYSPTQPELITQNINYHIVPTHLPRIYKLIINKTDTNIYKSDIIQYK